METNNLRGRIHKDYSPFTTIGDLVDFAKQMVGKPVTIDGVVVGKIISAEIEENHIAWEAMPFHNHSFDTTARNEE